LDWLKYTILNGWGAVWPPIRFVLLLFRQYNRPVTQVVLGSMMALGMLYFAVARFTRIAEPSDTISDLLAIALLIAGAIIVVTSLTISAIKASLERRTGIQHLLTILVSYLCMTLVFARVYFSISTWTDFTDASQKYSRYRQETKVNTKATLVNPPYDRRAFNGIKFRLWSGVDWPDLARPSQISTSPILLEDRLRESLRPFEDVVKFQSDARLNVFLDCLHFSVATITTPRWGDITPRSGVAKFISDLEVFIGLTLLVVALGMFFSNWRPRDDENNLPIP